MCLHIGGRHVQGYFWLKRPKSRHRFDRHCNIYSVYQTYVYFLAILAKNNPVRAGPLCVCIYKNIYFYTMTVFSPQKEEFTEVIIYINAGMDGVHFLGVQLAY